jgi:hypothetical protein
MKGSSLAGILAGLSPLEEVEPNSGCEVSSLGFLGGGSEVVSGVAGLELVAQTWG